MKARLIFTPRERIRLRGYCTGPEDGAPAPGQVGLDYKAPCCTCGKRVTITVRGRYTHHKAPLAVTSGTCKACETRANSGLPGQCPACAKERTREQLSSERNARAEGKS